ncbi:MAG: diguanylate cyclase [Gammaproteobacteria bacterium]|nr:diguanylate cyclase [Gammaproteobacteria bacterium]
MQSRYLSTFRSNQSVTLITLLTALLLFTVTSSCRAAPQPLQISWFQATDSAWTYQNETELASSGLRSVSGVEATGGHFWYQADFSVANSGRYVLDFKNSSTIGLFQLHVFDSNRHKIARLEGGIQSNADNPFFLRHGREITLAAGTYRLIGEMSGPFFLAQPEPYLNTLADYRHAIKPGNALVLLSLGIFLGLGIYYATLSLARQRMVEAMYALFILGNLLYNSMSLLVFPELFKLNWIYLVSVPILFSNIAYIVFVMSLLEIRRVNFPGLYWTGRSLMAVMLIFIILAGLLPNWSLEFARYGVALFLMYGLTAGIMQSRQGLVSASLYLIAIVSFFILGGIAITQSHSYGSNTFYIEHVGLFAVAVEVILLGLVLSYQFAELQREKEHIQTRLKHKTKIAQTDSLTGLANRYALTKELHALPKKGSFTYIDLDRLKYYNDAYGHAHGDELLRKFSRKISRLLMDKAKIYRVGGDEFSILCSSGDLKWVEHVLSETVAYLHAEGFKLAGASSGTAYRYECHSLSDLKHLADIRMYENKQQRKEPKSA